MFVALVLKAAQFAAEKLASHPDITSIMHFTGFFIRLAGPISGAGRNEEKHHEGHEARSAPSSRGPIESRPSISLGAGYSPRRQADR